MKLLNELSQTDGTKHMIAECIETARNYDRIVLFGAGVGGGVLYSLLDANGLIGRVVAWSDNNRLKFNTTYMNDALKVISPIEIAQLYGTDVGIMVSSSAYNLIRDQLIGYGIPQKNIYLFNFAFMDLEYTDYHFIMDHIEDFERAYARMSDDKSRKIFINLLNYKITKNSKYLELLQKYVDDEKYQYFEENIFEVLSSERFLDVGAYTGDIFEVYQKVYKNGWCHYYGIEADQNIYKELLKTIGKSDSSDKCSLYNVAAWNEDTTLYFDSIAGSSSMQENQNAGKISVDGRKIDNIITDEITFIKMDIEGAEYNALVGMSGIIRRNKPILAICVYHLRDDYYKLTDLVEKLVPGEYKFYLRQYRYTPTETVCYMIPQARRIE